MISNTFLGVAKPMKNQAEIYFAGGCFWGTEHFLKQIRGVESTQDRKSTRLNSSHIL